MSRTRPLSHASLVAAVLAWGMVAPATAAAAELKLRAMLNGGSVVSATESAATGEARLLLDDDGVRVDLVYSELDESATGAELRLGKPSENGSTVEKMDLEIEEAVGRVIGARFEVSPAVAERIRLGEAYLVITTLEHPDGVIRGQLLPQPVRLPEPPPDLPLAED